MNVKTRRKYRGFWITLVTIGIIAIGILIAPNFINLNKLRPHLESAIFAQTGVNLKIHGDINFGFLGATHLIAHDIETPNGFTKTLAVNVPFWGLFDLDNTKLNSVITVYDAHINLHSLSMLQLQYNMAVNNAVLNFMDKDYRIIHGIFKNGTFNGQVRTNDHKYDIAFQGNDFTIKNKNLKLVITGEYFPSGGAAGILEINTNKINSWFDFSEPHISYNVNLTTNFYWDGGYGFKFSDLVANNVHGNITIEPNGWRIIELTSDDLSFDFSFLMHPTKILHDTTLNIDFFGEFTIGNYRFEHLKLDVIGTNNYVQINKIIADDTSLTGGMIDADGAHDIMLRTNIDGNPTECLFSGTDTKWQCKNFVYDDIYGTIQFDNDTLDATVASNRTFNLSELESYIKKISFRHATVKFKFANMGGVFTISDRGSSIHYDYMYGERLGWINPHIHILPEFMLNATGNMTWTDKTFSFVPNTNDWSLTLQDNFFYITGTDIRKWFTDTDLRSIKKLGYTISGFYNDRGDISDLTIQIGDHTFTGTADTKSITLHTERLYIDNFLNPEFFDRYEEMEFLANSPILLPFNFSMNVYLTSDRLIYHENEYKNFVYSLKSGTQTFSITDNARGNMLATIIKERSKYDIFIQLNKFTINGRLLSTSFPINITDTSVTAEINLHTHGHIAHDIKYNMTGDMDLTFDGGYLTGIGLDNFYSDAENITRLNADARIMNALESGVTRIKNMRIIGKYENGDFTTTEPLKISVRHAEILGNLNISSNAMNALFDITMRGVATTPVLVSLTVAPNGRRGYSISDLMQHIDPGFMRSFIKTHDKF